MILIMADVIALVADGMATGSIVLSIIFILFYFILSSDMLNRTPSHIWGRWYLPMFLFRDGLLTLLFIAPFSASWGFGHLSPVYWIFSSVVILPVVLKWSYIEEGAFRCSLSLSWRLCYVFLMPFHPVPQLTQWPFHLPQKK